MTGLLQKWSQKAPPGNLCPSLRPGGRIDQAHHDSRAYMALHETIALDDAIAKGLELTDERETLTVVMADHSHALTFNGFPFRGQSILGNYGLAFRVASLLFHPSIHACMRLLPSALSLFLSILLSSPL